MSILNLEVFYYALSRPDGGNFIFFLHSVFGIGLESPWFEWRPLRRRSARGGFHNPMRTRAKSKDLRILDKNRGILDFARVRIGL